MLNYLFYIIDTIKLNRVQVYITIISKTFCQTKVYLWFFKGNLVRYCNQATIISHGEPEFTLRKIQLDILVLVLYEYVIWQLFEIIYKFYMMHCCL